MAEQMKIKITADGSQARRELNQTKGSIKSVGASIFTLRNALITLGTGIALRTIKNTSAEFENLRNRLKLVTDSSEELESRFRQLTQAATENRTGLIETIDLFTKLRIATEELGVSDERVLVVTNRLSKALQLAGADTMTAQAVIRQFGQAMASGTVRGDEFRSIVEGLGPALSIMARQTGISVGKLRELSLSGKLTADVFFEMLENATLLDDEFKKLDATIDSLETAFGNAFDRAVVKLGEALGVTKAYKELLEETTLILDIFATDMGKLDEFFFASSENISKLAKSNENLNLNLRILEDHLESIQGFSGLFSRLLFPEDTANLIKQIEDAILTVQQKINKLNEEQKKNEESVTKVKAVEFSKQTQSVLDFLLTEEQALVSAFEKKRDILEKELENQKLSKVQRERINLSIIKLDKKLSEELLEIRRKQIQEEAKQDAERLRRQEERFNKQLQIIKNGKFNELELERLTNDQIMDLTKASGRELLGELAKHNRLAFALNKALAIRDAIMNTARGVSKALALGPLGIPLAGIIGGLGAVQVATIAKQQYTGRRLGGRVDRDKPFIVGEAGPELFVPDQGGNIVPNNKLGAQTVHVNFTINAVDTRGFRSLLNNERGTIVNIINTAVTDKGRAKLV
jgi:tape measure domain-containing protein